jgi:ubiquinone/menaquinone biosynthesis C-methylase UbiE
MSIIDYFSNDENKRSKFIFNLIAPIYQRIGKNIASKYVDLGRIIEKEIGIKGKSVLDIGTGSGAWAKVFQDYLASKVIGIDSAKKMVLGAKKNFPEIEFLVCDGEKLSIFGDNSFDIVTASFVLHGVKKEHRKNFLRNMKRVSKEYVVINDFYGEVGIGIRMLEALERSDMLYFKDHFLAELKENFSSVYVKKVGKSNGIYIAKK